MNEIFNIRRFAALVIKFYRENRAVCLFFLAIMAISTFVCINGPTGFLRRAYIFVSTQQELEGTLEHFKQIFAAKYWGLTILFSIFTALYSFRYITSKTKVTRALTLPASNFEKYLLALLNSTLVPLVVTALLFYSIGTISIHKYVGITGASISEGKFIQNENAGFSENQKNFRVEIGNVFSLNQGTIKYTKAIDKEGRVREVSLNPVLPFWSWHSIPMSWLFIVSVCMWGAISFRKRPLLLILLVHSLLFIILGSITVYCVYKITKDWNKSYEGLHFYGTAFAAKEPSPKWILLFYLLPVVYQGVIWWKLKTKQA